MDEDTPSKRLTWGIFLHGKNVVDGPSFSLGLTQVFGDVAGSLAKLNHYSASNSNQEMRSKHKNDPIVIEQSISKSNNKGEKF